MADEFLIKSVNRRTGASVVVEDDGRVCYAYFLSPAGEISGDVWLYNHCPAPEQPEWRADGAAPFANPAEYTKQEPGFGLPETENDISFQWSEGEAVEFVDIFVRAVRIGRAQFNEKPGWALAVTKDGPLAKVLRNPD